MSAPPKKVVGVGLACQDLLILWRDLSAPLVENRALCERVAELRRQVEQFDA